MNHKKRQGNQSIAQKKKQEKLIRMILIGLIGLIVILFAYIKYKKLFSDNAIAATKIQRFLRKYYLKKPSNKTKDEISSIPGLFRYRLSLSSSNLIKPIDNISLNNISSSLGFTLDQNDIQLNKAIFYSLSLNNNEDNAKINILIDLRTYGPNPHLPIYINNIPYYLNDEQIILIKKIWNKVDPNTAQGIRTKQNLEYIKTSNYLD